MDTGALASGSFFWDGVIPGCLQLEQWFFCISLIRMYTYTTIPSFDSLLVVNWVQLHFFNLKMFSNIQIKSLYSAVNFFFFISFFFAMYSQLTWNLLSSPGWFWIHHHPASWVMRLWICAFTSCLQWLMEYSQNSQIWWLTPVISALERSTQEDWCYYRSRPVCAAE